MYDLDEHRHRLAVWAAARAAQRGAKGFSVRAGRLAIEACGLRAATKEWRSLPEPTGFDAQHHAWCKAVAKEIRCSYGRAAKLVNMYLKLRLVCGPVGDEPEAQTWIGAIHPPIDRRLLEGLARKCAKGTPLKRQFATLATTGWTAFDPPAYQAAIAAVRAWLEQQHGEPQPLWMAEEHWDPAA